MKIVLKEYDVKQIKDLFKIVIEIFNYKDLKNLGYLNSHTWKKVFQNRKSKKHFFKIILNEGFVGWIALTYEHEEKSWNVAYMIFKKYRKKKIATLAVKELLRFARKKKIKHIHTKTDNENFGSIMVLKKNGFILIKEVANEIYWRKTL